jgi:hypothetical protein
MGLHRADAVVTKREFLDELEILLGANQRARVARKRDHWQSPEDGIDARRSSASSRRWVRVRSAPGISSSSRAAE